MSFMFNLLSLFNFSIIYIYIRVPCKIANGVALFLFIIIEIIFNQNLNNIYNQHHIIRYNL